MSQALPAFSQLDPQAFPAQCQQLLDQARSEVAALTEDAVPPSWYNLMAPLEAIDDRIGQLQTRQPRRRIIRSDHQCLDLGMQRSWRKRRQKSQQGQENTTHRHGPKVSDQSRSDNPRLTPWLTRASLKSCTPVSGKNSTAR